MPASRVRGGHCQSGRGCTRPGAGVTQQDAAPRRPQRAAPGGECWVLVAVKIGAGEAIRPHDLDFGKTRSARLSKVESVVMNSTIPYAVQEFDGILRADAFFCSSNRFWWVQAYWAPIPRLIIAAGLDRHAGSPDTHQGGGGGPPRPQDRPLDDPRSAPHRCYSHGASGCR